MMTHAEMVELVKPHILCARKDVAQAIMSLKGKDDQRSIPKLQDILRSLSESIGAHPPSVEYHLATSDRKPLVDEMIERALKDWDDYNNVESHPLYHSQEKDIST